jgi:hypothetical protein
MSDNELANMGAAIEAMDDVVSFDEVNLSDSDNNAPDTEVIEGEANEEAVEQDDVEDSEEPKEDAEEEVNEEGEEAVSEETKENSGDDSDGGNSDGSEDFVVKVDGEEEKVSLQDLKNSYSGKKAVDRRFSDLNVEKTQFNAEKDEVIGKITKFAQAANAGNTIEAIQHLADLAGQDALELQKNLRSQAIEIAKKYVEMSPEQQNLFDIQQENNYYKEREAMNNQQLEVRDQQDNLESRISDMQRKHNISDKELVEVYDDLAKSSDAEIKVADIESHYFSRQSQSKASDLLNQVDPNSVTENNVKDVSDFILQNPNVSEAEVLDIIKEAFPAQAVQESEGKSPANIIKKRVKASNPNASVSEEEIYEDDGENDAITSFDDVII